MAEHNPGNMDISEQKKTFGKFINVIVYSSVVIALILIFLAIVGT